MIGSTNGYRCGALAGVVFAAAAFAAGGVAAQDTPPGSFLCDLSDAAGFGIGVDPSAEIEVTLTASEREVLDLAIPGYIADISQEAQGALSGRDDAGPFGEEFFFRHFGLEIFINTTVPCIEKKINGREFQEGVPPFAVQDDGSVRLTLNSFERVAIQIMMQIWNPRDGVMAHHIRGCQRSAELRQAQEFADPSTPNLCATFFPLAAGAKSLFEKVSRDQK